jgi:thiamine kinase-like enzyme
MIVAMLTPEQIAQRTQRAVDTAVRAGRELGLEIADPKVLYDARVSLQASHGDAPPYNVIRTRGGHRCADFEDVTLGPVEWDMAMLDANSAASYDAAAGGAGVRTLDRDVLRVMDAARLLQVVACYSMVSALPMLATGLAPSLDHWRTTPLAGGLC